MRTTGVLPEALAASISRLSRSEVDAMTNSPSVGCIARGAPEGAEGLTDDVDGRLDGRGRGRRRPESGKYASSSVRRGNASRRASPRAAGDRKSTRLNSSHANISYAVFCFKKKKKKKP